jgi:hypothetical protein
MSRAPEGLQSALASQNTRQQGGAEVADGAAASHLSELRVALMYAAPIPSGGYAPALGDMLARPAMTKSTVNTA